MLRGYPGRRSSSGALASMRTFSHPGARVEFVGRAEESYGSLQLGGASRRAARKLEAEFDQHLEYSYNQGAEDNDVQRLISKLQKECEPANSSLSMGKA